VDDILRSLNRNRVTKYDIVIQQSVFQSVLVFEKAKLSYSVNTKQRHVVFISKWERSGERWPLRRSQSTHTTRQIRRIHRQARKPYENVGFHKSHASRQLTAGTCLLFIVRFYRLSASGPIRKIVACQFTARLIQPQNAVRCTDCFLPTSTSCQVIANLTALKAPYQDHDKVNKTFRSKTGSNQC